MCEKKLTCADCCTVRNRSCCRDVTPSLTLGDVARISAVASPDLAVAFIPVEGDYASDDDPEWAELAHVPGGKYRLALRNLPEHGGCAYLTPTGCSLAMDVRPLVCRIYPWNFNAQSITSKTEECPGWDGVSRDDAEKWRSQLYDEIRRMRNAF